jgi:hypothetical protein
LDSSSSGRSDIAHQPPVGPVYQKTMCAIFEWRNTPKPDVKPQFLPYHYAKMFDAQSIIGWHHIIKGCWSTLWVRHHVKHAQINKIKQKGETWASTTLHHTWENIYDVWKQ